MPYITKTKEAYVEYLRNVPNAARIPRIQKKGRGVADKFQKIVKVITTYNSRKRSLIVTPKFSSNFNQKAIWLMSLPTYDMAPFFMKNDSTPVTREKTNKEKRARLLENSKLGIHVFLYHGTLGITHTKMLQVVPHIGISGNHYFPTAWAHVT